jgi:protein-S-isoprenylcysteine O-methyltransferase Ste14
MNAGFLVIPIILIRYGLMALLSREALKRAAHFAPLEDNKKWAYWVNVSTSIGMMIFMFFIKVSADTAWFFAGLALYVIGAVLYAVSVINYAKPKTSGINTSGLYKVSRNPMYVAYFIYFLGCAVMTSSLILLAILLAYQVSTHVIIVSEERWCVEKFGGEYSEYMKRVRRYI